MAKTAKTKRKGKPTAYDIEQDVRMDTLSKRIDLRVEHDAKTNKRLESIEARVDCIAKYLEEEHDRQAKFRDGTKAKLDTLLSQRSMTEEKWEPVEGQYYTAIEDLGWYKKGCIYQYGRHGGRPTELLAMCDRPNSSITFVPEHHCRILRPATQAEIDAYLKAEEEAKPIPFGTRVRWRGYDAMYVENDQSRLKEASHVLMVNAGDHPYLTYQDRDSFTITNP